MFPQTQVPRFVVLLKERCDILMPSCHCKRQWRCSYGHCIFLIFVVVILINTNISILPGRSLAVWTALVDAPCTSSLCTQSRCPPTAASTRGVLQPFATQIKALPCRPTSPSLLSHRGLTASQRTRLLRLRRPQTTRFPTHCSKSRRVRHLKAALCWRPPHEPKARYRPRRNPLGMQGVRRCSPWFPFRTSRLVRID